MRSRTALLKSYYQLTKPGIIYGNAITATAGFFLASKGSIDVGLFIATLFGVSAVIAAACVFNNYIDRGIDAKMSRTKDRAIVSGAISGRNAIIYGIILSVIGFTLLTVYVNIVTVIVGLVGMFFYVVLYGLAKRKSIYGTEVGSVSGSMPVVAGYTAVTGHFDTAALLLFLILTFWQMPHFYAIAMYRLKDYAAAGLPVMPVVKGIRQTKIRMIIYIIAFGLAASALSVYGYTGYTYRIVIVLATFLWLWRGRRGFDLAFGFGFGKRLPANFDNARWARKMFGFSLIVLLAFSLAISVDAWLP